jgi:hypothetical protein
VAGARAREKPGDTKKGSRSTGGSHSPAISMPSGIEPAGNSPMEVTDAGYDVPDVPAIPLPVWVLLGRA